MLREKNLTLAELQLYINNIPRCLVQVALLYENRQDHQFITLIKCYTFLQVHYLQIRTVFNKPLISTKISERYPRPTQFLFLSMSHSIYFAYTIKDIMAE